MFITVLFVQVIVVADDIGLPKTDPFQISFRAPDQRSAYA